MGAASPALPEPTFRLNNCDLAVRGSAIPDAAFLSRCFNWAGRREGSFSERKASPWDCSVLAELPHSYLKGGGGGGGEKNWEQLWEVFTAMSGQNLSAEILTFFNFFSGGRGGQRGAEGGRSCLASAWKRKTNAQNTVLGNGERPKHSTPQLWDGVPGLRATLNPGCGHPDWGASRPAPMGSTAPQPALSPTAPSLPCWHRG